MLGLLLAASPAAEPGPLKSEQVIILFYGDDAEGGCGYFYFGQSVRVRYPPGGMADFVLACAKNGRYRGEPLPAPGSVCDITYRSWPATQIAVKLISDRTDPGSPVAIIESMTCRPPQKGWRPF